MGSRVNLNGDLVAAAVEFGVAGVQRCVEGFGQCQVGRVVAGVSMAQAPDALGQWRRVVSVDEQIEVVDSCALCHVLLELLTQHQAPQHGQDFYVEDVGGGDLAGEKLKETVIDVAPHQCLDHGRGVDDDHRRDSCRASTMSAPLGPLARSLSRRRATISAFVGREAIRASSAAT